MKKKILYWLFIIGLFLGLNTNGNVINANGISLKNEDASANEIIEYEENLLEKIENAYDNAENSIIYDYDGNDITLVVFEMYEKCDSNLIKYALVIIKYPNKFNTHIGSYQYFLSITGVKWNL